MRKLRIVSNIISVSVLVYFFSAKKIMDHNIKHNIKKEIVVEHIFNDFSYELSPENRKKAERIVTRLLNNKEVYAKLDVYSSFLTKSKEKLNYIANNREIFQLDSAMKLIDTQQTTFSKMVLDLHKNKEVSKNLDSLFTIFTTNSDFKNKFKFNVSAGQLRRNPLYFIDSEILFNRPRKEIHTYNSPSYHDSKTSIKGFTSMQRKVTTPKRMTPKPSPSSVKSDSTHKLLLKKKVGRR